MSLSVKPLASALLLSFAAISAGCVIHVNADEDGTGSYDTIAKREQHNRDVIAALALGTPAAVVREQLGEPEFTEANRVKGHEVRVLRYRTHRKHSDGDTTQDETTALVFTDGKLSGIGDAAAAQSMTTAP